MLHLRNLLKHLARGLWRDTWLSLLVGVFIVGGPAIGGYITRHPWRRSTIVLSIVGTRTAKGRFADFLQQDMRLTVEHLVALLDGGVADALRDCSRRGDIVLDPGLPPEKWSSLIYGLWPDGGLKNAKEETHGRRDRHEAAAG